MPVQDLPRATVRLGLSVARLPLAGAEILLRRGRDDEWAPALAFEGFEASVKQIVGGLLSDEALVEEGRLEAAKVGRLRTAVQLEAVAEQRREAATSEFVERRERDEQARRQADRVARERKAELARQAEEKQERLDAATARAEQAARQQEAAEAENLDRAARRARTAALASEKQAVAKERAAVEKARKAAATDQRIRGSRKRQPPER